MWFPIPTSNMKPRNSQSSSKRAALKSRRFMPKFEILEDRVVPTLTFTTQPVDTATGEVMAAVQVHSDSLTSVPITLSLTEQSTSGTPILGGTITQATNASGNASFTTLMIYGGSAKNATFVATSGTDVATSTVFQVKLGADHLYISSTIPTTAAGTSLGTIFVQEQDINGLVASNDNQLQVQLYLANNPGGASFVNSSGNPITTPITAIVVKGVATFQGLMLNKAGLGYILGAEPFNNSTILPVASNSFNVAAGPAVGLGFQIQPTYTGVTDVGINNYSGNKNQTWSGVVVQVVDKFGNQLPGPFTAGSVTMAALDQNGAPVTFAAGTITQKIDPITAVASFTDLRIGTMENNYTLLAAGSVQVGGQTIELGASTTLDAAGKNGSISVASAALFPAGGKFLILISQGATSREFQVTAGAGTTTWTINGDASAFTTGAVVTLFAATSVPFNVGPQRGNEPSALKFITPPPTQFPIGQTIQANAIFTMTGAGVSPIVVTVPNNGLVTGQQVVISGATGNTAANGTWTVTAIDANDFSLNTSTGNNIYNGGATWSLIGAVGSATGAGSGKPIVITSSTVGLVTGNRVIITGSSFAAANGAFNITVIDANSFSLDDTTATGTGTGGSWLRDSSSVQVAVTDQSGNVITADDTDQLSLNGGRFLGTKVVTVKDGVATFSGIMITGALLAPGQLPKIFRSDSTPCPTALCRNRSLCSPAPPLPQVRKQQRRQQLHGVGRDLYHG